MWISKSIAGGTAGRSNGESASKTQKRHDKYGIPIDTKGIAGGLRLIKSYHAIRNIKQKNKKSLQKKGVNYGQRRKNEVPPLRLQGPCVRSRKK